MIISAAITSGWFLIWLRETFTTYLYDSQRKQAEDMKRNMLNNKQWPCRKCQVSKACAAVFCWESFSSVDVQIFCFVSLPVRVYLGSFHVFTICFHATFSFVQRWCHIVQTATVWPLFTARLPHVVLKLKNLRWWNICQISVKIQSSIHVRELWR